MPSPKLYATGYSPKNSKKLIGRDDSDHFRSQLADLSTNAYQVAPRMETWMPLREWFCTLAALDDIQQFSAASPTF